MYLIEWCDGSDGIFSYVAANAKAAWQLYWVAKEYTKAIRREHLSWITIFTNGCYLDPTKGSKLPPKLAGEDHRTILRK